MAAVGADEHERLRGAARARESDPTARAAEIEVRRRPRSGRAPPSRTTLRCGPRRPGADSSASGAAVDARAAPRTPVSAGLPRAATTWSPSGQPARRAAATSPQGPACSTRRKARTWVAVPAQLVASGRSAARRCSAQSHAGSRRALAEQAATQHDGALRARSGSVARREDPAGAELVDRRTEPGRDVEACGRRGSGAAVRRGHGVRRGRRDGGAAECRSSRSRATRPARRARGAAGTDACVRNRSVAAVTTSAASSPAYVVGEGREPRGRARRARSSGCSRARAGRCSAASAPTSGSTAWRTQVGPGALVDAEGDVQAGGLLRAGGVWSSGRAGTCRRRAASSDSSTRQSEMGGAGPVAVGVVDLPELGAVGLEDEDVVAVLVHGEALGAGRGQIGVDLARVAELELEVRGERRESAARSGAGPGGRRSRRRRRALRSLAGVDADR